MWVTESPYSEYSAYTIHHFNCCEFNTQVSHSSYISLQGSSKLGYPEMIILLGTSLLNFNDFDPSTRCVCMATLVPDKWIRVGLTEHWIRREHLFHLPQELGTLYEAKCR